jgi:hypothetical protein
VGQKSRNLANDTAFSRGVVGYGVGWVCGWSLVAARGVVVEIGEGFRGGRGRWAKGQGTQPTTPRFHAASLAMEWGGCVDGVWWQCEGWWLRLERVSRGEGEVGHKSMNPANDTAFSRGVVGNRVARVRGWGLMATRGVVLEIGGGFPGGGHTVKDMSVKQ